MCKSAVRLWTLAICAAAIVVVPTVTPAKAATVGSGGIEKNKKKIIPKAATVGSGDQRFASTWPPPMDDDFDRKNGGAGGM